MTTRQPHRLHALTAAIALTLGSAVALAGDDIRKQSPGETYQGIQNQNPQARDEGRKSLKQGQSQARRDQQRPSPLDQLTQQRDDLSTFAKAVQTTGLGDSLAGDEYTIFAPTDDAFDQLGRDRVQQLLQPENRQQLIALMRGHIVNDSVDEQMFRNTDAAKTIDGDTVKLSEQDGRLTVGDARVVEPNLSQGNLRVFVIDQVLAKEALQGRQARPDRQQVQQPRQARDGEQQRAFGQPRGEEEEAE